MTYRVEQFNGWFRIMILDECGIAICPADDEQYALREEAESAARRMRGESAYRESLSECLRLLMISILVLAAATLIVRAWGLA